MADCMLFAIYTACVTINLQWFFMIFIIIYHLQGLLTSSSISIG
eukprot:SAG11_NODE_2521_length_3261_cov_1.530993_8_plen_44_part_00